MGWPGWARLLLLAAACHGQTQVSLQGAEGEALVDEALVQVDRKRRSKKSESVETEAKTPVPGLATAAQDSCAVLAAQRTDCGFPGISGEECVLTPGCCYLEDTAEGVPWCFHNAGVTVDLLSAAEEASTVAEAGRASKTGPYTDSAEVALDADVARSSKPTAFSSVDIGADAEKWDILDEKGMFEKKTDQKKTEPKTKQEKSTRPEEDQVSTYADKDKAKSKGGNPPASDGAALKPFSWSDPFSSSSVGPSLPAVDDKGSDKGKGQKKGSDASTTLAPVSDKDKTTNSAAKDEAKPVAKDEAKAGKDEALAKAVADMLADEDKKMKTKLEDEKKKEKEEKDKLDAEKKLREKEEADKKEKERALQQEDEYRKKKEDKAKKEEEEKKRKEEDELQRMKKEEEEEEKRLKLREQEQERLQKEEADKKAKEDKEALQKAKEAQTAAKKAKAAAMKAKAANDKLAADKAKVDSAAAPAAASVGTSKPDSNTKMAAGEQPVDKPVPAPAADAPVPSSTKPAADGAVTASKPAADAPVSASKSSAAADQTAAPVLTDPATKDGSSKSKQPESDQGAAATSTKALPDPVDKPTSAAAVPADPTAPITVPEGAKKMSVVAEKPSLSASTEPKNVPTPPASSKTPDPVDKSSLAAAAAAGPITADALKSASDPSQTAAPLVDAVKKSEKPPALAQPGPTAADALAPVASNFDTVAASSAGPSKATEIVTPPASPESAATGLSSPSSIISSSPAALPTGVPNQGTLDDAPPGMAAKSEAPSSPSKQSAHKHSTNSYDAPAADPLQAAAAGAGVTDGSTVRYDDVMANPIADMGDAFSVYGKNKHTNHKLGHAPDPLPYNTDGVLAVAPPAPALAAPTPAVGTTDLPSTQAPSGGDAKFGGGVGQAEQAVGGLAQNEKTKPAASTVPEEHHQGHHSKGHKKTHSGKKHHAPHQPPEDSEKSSLSGQQPPGPVGASQAALTPAPPAAYQGVPEAATNTAAMPGPASLMYAPAPQTWHHEEAQPKAASSALMPAGIAPGPLPDVVQQQGTAPASAITVVQPAAAPGIPTQYDPTSYAPPPLVSAPVAGPASTLVESPKTLLSSDTTPIRIDATPVSPPSIHGSTGKPQTGTAAAPAASISEEKHRAEAIVARLAAIEDGHLSEQVKAHLRAPLEAMLWADVNHGSPPGSAAAPPAPAAVNPTVDQQTVAPTALSEGSGPAGTAHPDPAPAVKEEPNSSPASNADAGATAPTPPAHADAHSHNDPAPAPAAADPQASDGAVTVGTETAAPASEPAVAAAPVPNQQPPAPEPPAHGAESPEAVAADAPPISLVAPAARLASVPAPFKSAKHTKDGDNVVDKVVGWLFPDAEEDMYAPIDHTAWSKYPGSINDISKSVQPQP